MKILKIVIAMILSLNVMCMPSYAADILQEDAGMGDEAVAIDDVSDIIQYYQTEDSSLEQTDMEVLQSLASTSSFAKTVDLSTSNYFPPVYHDSDIVNTTSFASVYYQYTYEVNKLHKTSGKKQENIASPAWPCNVLASSSKSDYEHSFDRLYKFLKQQGDVSLADMAFDKNDQITWCTDMDAMREALSTRLNANFKVTISGDVTGTSDNDLTTVKALLSAGKVLTAYIRQKLITEVSTTYGEVICQGVSTDDTRQGVAIVGYNDNVCVDVNGDGEIEEAEKGAFKVMLPKDDGKGYAWVLYDALNTKTQISNASNEKKRKPVFSSETSTQNVFYAVYVQDYEVDLVGEVQLTTEDRSDLLYSLQVNGEAVNEISSSADKMWVFSRTGGKYAFSGNLVYDVGQYMENKGDLLTGFEATATIKDVSSKTNTTNVTCYLKDNKGNVISKSTTTGQLQGAQTKKTIQFTFIKGDVDYDGKVTASDSLSVNRQVVGLAEFSDLQNYLGDVNNDDEITAEDALEILNIVVGL